MRLLAHCAPSAAVGSVTSTATLFGVSQSRRLRPAHGRLRMTRRSHSSKKTGLSRLLRGNLWRYDDSWGLDRVDQRAIDASGGSPYDGFYRYSADGTGVNVYVVDTGIRTTHADFEGRAVIGFDAIGDGNTAGDCHGHGTHVAG